MYTAYYNLREEPFRLTSDPRFFHLAEPHAAALATLVEAVMRRKGFLLLTGPIGTGKTTVVHTALQILTERAATGHPISSAFILNPTLSREEFLEMILTEFEIPCTATSKPARLSALQRMLLETQRKGGTSLLLVDEAHLLTPELLEEIRLLSNADTYQEKLLQIVLCGQPELLGILAKPELRALRQRVASTCSLRPLSFAEVRAYVAERLQSAGFRGATSLFPTPVLEAIFRLTEGVPRLINLLCDACLALGCRAHRPVVDLNILENAATDLGLNEKHVEPVIGQTSVVAGNGAGEREVVVAGDTVICTALDLLVQAMKRRRALVPEAIQIRPDMSVKEQVAVTVNANQGKDPDGDQVIQSAVNVLIQAMKLRGSSTMEL
jgi:general secretion pathway protein A